MEILDFTNSQQSIYNCKVMYVSVKIKRLSFLRLEMITNIREIFAMSTCLLYYLHGIVFVLFFLLVRF